jgi:hypothetical protein
LLSLTEEQTQTLYCFKTYIRENDYEDEICDYCLTESSLKKFNPKKCKCSNAIFHIGDFKLYEKLLPLMISEVSYNYDPMSRYVYVLNQNRTILRVLDMDDLESYEETELDGYENLVLQAIRQDALMILIYSCCQIMKDVIPLNAKTLLRVSDLVDDFFIDPEFSQRRILILFSIIHQEEHPLFKYLLSHNSFLEHWNLVREKLGGPND